MTFVAVLVIVCLVVWTWQHLSSCRRRGKLPPGPYPFPIIGNILQLIGKKPHHTLTKLSKTYGPIMSLHLANLYTVIVSSPDIAKEMLQKHDVHFSSHTIVEAARALNRHENSLLFLPVVKQWRKLRKICKEQLFSSHRLHAGEGLRQETLERLCEYVNTCCESNGAVNIGEAMFITMLNLMSTTLFSTQLTSFDSINDTQEFKQAIEGVTKILGVPNLADFFPILKPFDPQGIKCKLEFYLAKLLAIIEDIISQRLESTSDVDRKKNDLLETLLDLSHGTDYELTHNEITSLLMDLLVAGTDSTGSTAEWMMTELLLNREKLSKLKCELRTVIGETKQIQESDLSRLLYFEAVIKEVLRLHPPALLLVPYKAESDVQLTAYVVPKAAQVIINVWAISRDPNLWKNPNSFEPDDFWIKM